MVGAVDLDDFHWSPHCFCFLFSSGRFKGKNLFEKFETTFHHPIVILEFIVFSQIVFTTPKNREIYFDCTTIYFLLGL